MGTILVTGGTGFIGQALLRQLVEAGYSVRTLIRPSKKTPNLPLGVPVEVAVSALNDPRGLRAAMVNVDTVFHLAGGEWRGAAANLWETDIQGTQFVIQAAREAGIERLLYLSHLGADRGSAYPVLKTKAIAEEYIRRSGIDYTILRTALVYGQNDGFTTGLAQLLQALPAFFLIPGDGSSLLQPLWVEDLVTCLVWSLDEPRTRNQMIEVGGPEYFTFQEILKLVMGTLGVQRRLLPIKPAYMKWLTIFLEDTLPSLPVSAYWVDYLVTNRTCALDSVPRAFNLMPSRMSHRLAYLRGHNWRRSFWGSLFRKRAV